MLSKARGSLAIPNPIVILSEAKAHATSHAEQSARKPRNSEPHCDPERSEGPMQRVMLSKARGSLATPNPIVILSGAKDPCNESC